MSEDLAFAKLQAAGNAYIAVDGRDRELPLRDLAIRMGQHHFGVGSDGLVVVERSERAALRMRIFNTDGSESEMSGNGLRLFCKFAIDRGLLDPDPDGVEIETGGGVRRVWPRLTGGRMVSARIAMGEPRFEAAQIPVEHPSIGADERVVDLPLEVAGHRLSLTCLSLGNPHAVWIQAAPVGSIPLAAIGPAVQNHPFFPKRINFEVVQVRDRGRIRARVFERGEGETRSSGTGSTASAVAARLHGLVDDEIAVELAGGDLNVHWAGRGEALLDGPAAEVFTGTWPLAHLDTPAPRS